MQVVKRNVMVASRWCWVVDGGAVLLGNAMAVRCYWGISLRWCLVADGGALLGGSARKELQIAL